MDNELNDLDSVYDKLSEAEYDNKWSRKENNDLKELVRDILDSISKYDKEDKPEIANLREYLLKYCKDLGIKI